MESASISSARLPGSGSMLARMTSSAGANATAGDRWMQADSFALPIVVAATIGTYACPKHPRHVLPPLREHSLHDASVCNWRAVGLTKHCGKFTTTVVGAAREQAGVCQRTRAAKWLWQRGEVERAAEGATVSSSRNDRNVGRAAIGCQHGQQLADKWIVHLYEHDDRVWRDLLDA